MVYIEIKCSTEECTNMIIRRRDQYSNRKKNGHESYCPDCIKNNKHNQTEKALQSYIDRGLINRNTEEDFWSYIDKDPGLGASINYPNCWEYRGCLDRGYGIFVMNRKACPAHKYSYILTNGPVPKGLMVCHHCDNRARVRPDHLWLGTHAENQQDKIAKGRHTKGEENVHAILKDHDIPIIRIRLARGETPKSIAKDYGVSHWTIKSIKLGRTWSHII